MSKESMDNLSRRERQIMEILLKTGEATAATVQEDLPDPPSYSSVRTLLRILEDKGYIRHHKAGRSFVYTPRVNRTKAKRAALKNMVQTFFDGSVEEAVATLIGMGDSRISSDEYRRLSELIERHRKKARG